MPKQLSIQDAGGQPLASFDFGEVLPGTSSSNKALLITNTGDADIAAVSAWIEQTSIADGELKVTVGGVTITSTDQASATALGSLAVGVSLTGQAWFSVPADSVGVPVDTGMLRLRGV
ncbi:hypothetical protein GCM10008957_25140 [Deinococcus ruber]|uniref:Uncharacterized protein n=2 Tax=Deinococcus ruber TaxID=1848197 RepID=A0A918C8S7_9DEIO|nr:hypothetical protein GCM10008957_25140 [Deinococcus ruber]